MSAPSRFVEHLRHHGYHPRSSAHGNALCEFVLEDLLLSCRGLAEHATQAKLVYALNRKIMVGGNEWNIDLVLQLVITMTYHRRWSGGNTAGPVSEFRQEVRQVAASEGPLERLGGELVAGLETKQAIPDGGT